MNPTFEQYIGIDYSGAQTPLAFPIQHVQIITAA
jgi:hypothetical protein